MDAYKRGWALRYLREAKADLLTAEKSPVPMMAVSLAVLSMKKAQSAAYYVLGDPIYLEPLIQYVAEEETSTNDSLLKLLIKIERIIQVRNDRPESLTKKEALREASKIIEVATDIVNLVLTGNIQTPSFL